VESGGKLMIADLQGVKYILTDPQVHSTIKGLSVVFGAGDGGRDGMDDFFSRHVCNEICTAMKLPPHHKQPKTASGHLGETVANRPYASEVIGACGHLYTLQPTQRQMYLAANSQLPCPTCIADKVPKAAYFFSA